MYNGNAKKPLSLLQTIGSSPKSNCTAIIDQLVDSVVKSNKMHDGSKVTTEKIASWTNLYPCIETVAGENNKIVALRC